VGRAGRVPHGPGKRLTTDARLRNELELCHEWGIPHSQFRGIGDGTWTARDRAKALAYQAWRRTVCPQCNTRAEEWTDDRGEFVEAYIAASHKCFGCEEIARKQAEVPEGKPGWGVKVYLIPPAVKAALEVAEQYQRRHQH